MTEETGGHVIAWDINKAAIAEVAEDLKDVDAYKDLDEAKKAKKTLTKMRTALDAAHKETKAEALEFGRQCDAKKNEYLGLIRAIEDPISEDLDRIKNAAAVAEESRVSEIMGHIERLQAYALDRHSLTLAEMEQRRDTLSTEVIDPEMYQDFAPDAKLAKDEADLKLRLAIDREKTRLEEEAEKERVEAENKELREKLAKSEAEQAERDREAQKLVDKRAEEARASQKIIDDEKQAELDAQAEANRIEAKRLADEEAERQRVVDEEAAALFAANEKQKAEELAALQAPDLEKLEAYAVHIDAVIGLKPVMGSTQGSIVLLDTVATLVEAHAGLMQNIEEMK